MFKYIHILFLIFIAHVSLNLVRILSCPSNHRSLLQNIVSFIGLFCQRDLYMGWLQLVGSIKLQVSFAKETYKRENDRSLLQKRHVSLNLVGILSCVCLHRGMGWLQLVGSIKLQVSFAKKTYKRDNILQKRPVILSILLPVATPYHVLVYIYEYS